jgi:signal transduction histidine kinase
MESLDLLYYNRDDKIIFSESNLKKIILKALTPFQNSFNKKSIKISLFVEETFMINTNYELFNLIMHHFFHNTEKYTKESTTIHLNISKDTKNYLLIDMISLHIENKAKIFEE